MNYTLTNKEELKAKNFIKKHKKTCNKKQQNLPFSYKFTPTGIGIGIEIICPYCNNIENITDYNCW